MRVFLTWFVVAISISQLNSALAVTTAEQYLVAATQLEKLADAALVRKKMPRLKDDGVQELFKVVTDRSVIHAVAVDRKDLNQLLTICATSNALFVKYSLADVEYPEADIPAELPLSVRFLMQWVMNSKYFQDELSELQPFMIYCLAAQVPLLESYWRGLTSDQLTYARKQGLRQMISGVIQIYDGYLGIGSETGMRAGNRLKMIQPLADTAGVFASVLPIEVRKEFVGKIGRLVPASPEYVIPQLTKIKSEMLDMECKGFCEVLGD